MDRCQCPRWSMNHTKHNCPNLATKHVIRDGDELFLCGDCTLSGDVYKEEVKDGQDSGCPED